MDILTVNDSIGGKEPLELATRAYSERVYGMYDYKNLIEVAKYLSLLVLKYNFDGVGTLMQCCLILLIKQFLFFRNVD